MAESLTARQWKFCREYVKDRNGTKAAIRAGYSEEAAEAEARVLLKNTRILMEIAEFDQDLEVEAMLSGARIIRNLYQTAETARKCAQFNAAIAGYTQVGKHLGLFAERAKDADAINLPELLQALVSATGGRASASAADGVARDDGKV